MRARVRTVLIQHRRAADVAALREYVELLPSNYTCALAWTREQVQELQDPVLIETIEAEQAAARARFRAICRVIHAPTTEQRLNWALYAVRSRAFHVSFEGKSSVRTASNAVEMSRVKIAACNP